MIIDRLEHLDHYQEVLPYIENALSALKKYEKNFEVNVRYPFEGGVIFFQEGTTKVLSDTQFESHTKHIDVQVVLKGSEYVALESLENVTSVIPYSEEKDVEKYTAETKHYMKISEGMVYVCYPWDIHKAVFHIGEALHFTKAVIKLEIN